ncbi:hypothetical protein [Natrinema sp. SYSU A 869]|uniref:hypothetical protein n=1 Tax=Natrinema sp. SYSU A 869 TaxID=2871694 RepID=UPI001CA4699A|nr:hypothetical protein [Natrinema sp. SYSU A 869]
MTIARLIRRLTAASGNGRPLEGLYVVDASDAPVIPMIASGNSDALTMAAERTVDFDRYRS